MVDKFNSNFYRDWMYENFMRLQNVNIFGHVYDTKPNYLERDKMIELKYRTELQNGFIKLEYVDCVMGEELIPLIIEKNMSFDELIKRINYAISAMQAKAVKDEVPVPTLEQVLEKIEEEKKVESSSQNETEEDKALASLALEEFVEYKKEEDNNV